MEDEESKDPLDPIRAFVSHEKAVAFMEEYEPCDIEEAEEIFDDAGLRKYFGAYPRATGDPLVIYLDEELAPRHYRLQTDPMRREPVMAVRRKTI